MSRVEVGLLKTFYHIVSIYSIKYKLCIFFSEIIKRYCIVSSNTTHRKLIKLFHYSKYNVFLHSEENTTEQERQW